MTHTDTIEPATAHTPEPWHYETAYSITSIFAPDPTGQNPYGTYVAEIDGQDVGRDTTRAQHEANARRIVAAVNACAGIPTQALEQGVVAELLEVLQAIVETADTNPFVSIGYVIEHGSGKNAGAALAKATGQDEADEAGRVA
jgi:hypothetical protein